jgi:hypothetical protein
MKSLFWNVDFGRLDAERDADFILSRVLERGRLVDVRWAVSRYGLARIHRFFRDAPRLELSPRTVRLWRVVLRAEEEKWPEPPAWRRSSSVPWIVPTDVVRYTYRPLEAPVPGPAGFPTAGLLDLATNKLAAIAKRGLRRDFWDLYAIAKSGVSLDDACAAYVRRFGVAESDLYHVEKGLLWFEDAERVMPAGMTPKLWSTVRRYFEREVPRLVLGRR